MRKVLILCICMLILELLPIGIIYADSTTDKVSEGIESTLDKIDFRDFDSFVSDYLGDTEALSMSVKDYIKSIIEGKNNIGFDEVLSIITKYLMKDILSFLPLVVVVLGISILYSIVSSMSSQFASKGTTEIVYFVCYISIIVATLSSITMLLKDSVRVISNMNEFMTIIFPVLLTLMAALGGVVTVSTYQPLMATLTFLISGIVTKIILPLFIATIVFSVIGNLSGSMKLDKMNKSIKSVGEFILGMIFSLFSTFVTMQGITGSQIDSASIKSAKFAISSYVPVLGGYLSDGFDLTLLSAVLIKNSLGVVGIVVILLLIIAPVVKIAIFILVLRITSGIIEPIADSRMSSFVYSVSKDMTLLISIILGIAFMFFITTMLVILSLNSIF